MGIIKSILDNDYYTFSQQRAILDQFPDANVTYKFINRDPDVKFNKAFHEKLFDEIGKMQELFLTDLEAHYLMNTCPNIITEQYLKWLSNFRFNRAEVVSQIIDDQLSLEIRGNWARTIMWEAPLLALISECYYNTSPRPNLDQYEADAAKKGALLKEKDVCFSEFGTRRRRNFEVQDITVAQLKKSQPNFLGTSNVLLAMKHKVRPIGTMSHQWIMGISALKGLRHANRFAMEHWLKTYPEGGTMLPDTFGCQAFWNDFDYPYIHLFNTLRQDSGNPYEFGESAIKRYKEFRINPLHKTIIFSDGLNVQETIKIKEWFNGRINCQFGIGTHFSNDIVGSPALKIVIKMTSCNDIPVVKLSDTPEKATGDRDALRVAKWTFFNTPLDQN